MSWWGRFRAGLTRNWADTDGPGDPALTPPKLPLPPAEALARVPQPLSPQGRGRRTPESIHAPREAAESLNSLLPADNNIC